MERLKRKIGDDTGASMVLALAFFLICAIVGTTLLTAATVNAQAAVTYGESRDNNYTVGSAASLLADQLQDGVSLAWDWSTDPPQGTVTYPGSNTFAQKFWNDYVDDKMWSRDAKGNWRTQSITIENVEIRGPSGAEPVYATMHVDRDFNVKVYLSLSSDPDDVSPYDEVLSLQSIPTYNGKGQVTSVKWNTPVITKQGSVIPSGGDA